MKTNQVIRIIIPLVLLLGAATAFIVAVIGGQQGNTSVDEVQETNQAVTAFVAYLKIEGLDGEAQEQKYQNWIDVLAYSHNVMVPYSTDISRSAGTQQHAPLRITKMVDKTSPKLYEKCVIGEVIVSVKLTCCKPFGEQLLWFYNISLQNAIITSVQDYGMTAGDIPTETVSFMYEAIRWTYREYDAEGQAKGDISSGWINIETPE